MSPAHHRGGLVALVALVACWSAKPNETTTPIATNQPLVQSQSAGFEGSYWCSITSGDEGQYTYPKFPCAITREDNRLVLAKLGGSQRFTGEIVAATDGKGFTFAGTFYCPWGACTQPLHGEFRPSRDGVMIGRFSDEQTLRVRLWRAADGAFGGVGYGGGSYGGGMYGGNMYGGASYGVNHRKPRRMH